MRFVLLLLIVAFAADLPPTAAAQQVSANFLIAKSPRPVALDDWQPAEGRDTLSVDVPYASLRGYLYHGTDPNAPTILFFNDENVTISHSEALYRSLAALGPTVIVYDYRGLGYSAGQPDIAAARQDALVIYDRAVKTVRPGHPVVLYGFSVGTAVAASVATQRPATALILAAPMSSAAQELAIYTRLLGNPFAGQTPSPQAVSFLDVPALVAQSQIPLLVIHSDTDILVPFSAGQQVFAASTALHKQFVQLRNVPHGKTPANPEAMTAVKHILAASTATH